MVDYPSLKQQMGAYLLQLASAPGGPITLTQEQVCDSFGLDYRTPFLKMALYETAVDFYRDLGVIISALVINSVTGLPDMSFYALTEELGRAIPNKNDCWEHEINEIKRVFQHTV